MFTFGILIFLALGGMAFWVLLFVMAFILPFWLTLGLFDSMKKKLPFSKKAKT